MNMKLTPFEAAIKNLFRAESACINYNCELMFHESPTKGDLKRGYALANELGKALGEAFELSRLTASHTLNRKRLEYLAHCNVTHSESLQLLEQLSTKLLRHA